MYRPNDLRLYLWPHRLLLFVPEVETDCHRHHAAQLCMSLSNQPLRIRGNQGDWWKTGTAFFVPPDTEHQIANDEAPLALLYLDPEAAECARACRRFGSDGIHAMPDEALPSGWSQALTSLASNIDEADHFCQQLLGYPLGQWRALDPRLRRALAWLDSHLTESIRLPELARAANASESWLTHHFSEAIGVPVRRYVLWRRLRQAVEAALAGASLTGAAHQSGFADSAHLSRTFRDTFGVTPSFLFAARDRLTVVLCEDAGTAR